MKFLHNTESMWLLQESIAELVDKSTEPYDNHLTWIRSVKSDLDKLFSEFNATPGYEIPAKVVEVFQTQILNVFLHSWLREQCLEQTYIREFKKLVLAGFHEITILLNAKENLK